MHLTTSSTGRIVTVDKRLRKVLWELDFGSPVIAAYAVNKDGLTTIPFTSVAEEALDNLLEKLITTKLDDRLLLYAPFN